jgi:hypothetical protein
VASGKEEFLRKKEKAPRKKEFTGISSDTYQQLIVMMKV